MAWKDMLDEAIASGGKIHCPNGLPVGCIRHDGLMLEIEHGDHPTYIFPVDIEYIGELTDGMRENWSIITGSDEPGTDEQIRDMQGERHALIYTDSSMALTLYECNYAMFSLRTGRALGGRYINERYRLTDESLNKVRNLANKKGSETCF